MWQKKISVLIIMLMLTSVFAIGQPAENDQFEKTPGVRESFSYDSSFELWNVTLGGTNIDIGHDVKQTTDGGYIIVGYTRSFGDTSGRNIWLVKTDELGNEEWNTTFGGNNNDEGHSVQQTTDGGYILTGHTVSFGGTMKDVFLIKTDASGNQEWMEVFGGSYDDEGYSVLQTTDGGYIVAGATSSFATGGRNAWLIKTNASGDEEWTSSIGGLSSDGARSIQQTTDGGYIFTGWTMSYSAGYLFDIWLVKTDGLGNEQWSNNWGGTGTEADHGHSVRQTTDGGYIITGESQSYGGSNYDAILIKTDALGNEEWLKTFVGIYREYGHDVQQTIDGGYIVVGYTVSYGPGSDSVWVIRTDASGNELYTDTYGGTSSDVAYAVQLTTDGNYIIVGHTLSYGAGLHDVWLLKISEADESSLDISNVVMTTSDPLDTDPDYGWINISCEVTSDGTIDVVSLNISNPIGYWNNVTMSHGGDDVYYYNTTFTDHGLYSYFIWAIDTIGNTDESAVFDFLMPPNWDINMDGICDIWDVSLLSAQWMNSGVPGWIREDVNNDGMVDIWDISVLSTHWMESWQ